MVIAGMSYHDLARPMNCEHSSIVRLVERYTVTGSVKDRVRHARQRVTTVREDRQIVPSHLRDRFKTVTQTARELGRYNHQHISRQTVSRRLCEHGVKSFKAYRGNVLTPERVSESRTLVSSAHSMDSAAVEKCHLY